jgi:hypothetical protein
VDSQINSQRLQLDSQMNSQRLQLDSQIIEMDQMRCRIEEMKSAYEDMIPLLRHAVADDIVVVTEADEENEKEQGQSADVTKKERRSKRQKQGE